MTWKTSRFPYIGSLCVLFPVLTQFVMAAICFQTLSFISDFKYAFIAVFIMTCSPPSPPYLGHIVWVILCGSHCVGHIVWVTLCGPYCVGHIVWVTLCGSHCVGHIVWVVQMWHYWIIILVIFGKYDIWVSVRSKVGQLWQVLYGSWLLGHSQKLTTTTTSFSYLTLSCPKLEFSKSWVIPILSFPNCEMPQLKEISNRVFSN